MRGFLVRFRKAAGRCNCTTHNIAAIVSDGLRQATRWAEDLYCFNVNESIKAFGKEPQKIRDFFSGWLSARCDKLDIQVHHDAALCPNASQRRLMCIALTTVMTADDRGVMTEVAFALLGGATPNSRRYGSDFSHG